MIIFLIWYCYSVTTNMCPTLDYLMEVGDLLNPDLPDYDLVESNRSKIVWSSGKVPCIDICIKDNRGVYYSGDTVITAYIHELAHLLTPGHSHDSVFHDIQDSMIKKAIALNIISENYQVDESYPSTM